jgi:LPXTG-motif cell wall-anchored protein
MKILSAVLIMVGIGLIIMGLHSAFFPQEGVFAEFFEKGANNELNNQSLAMIGLGVLSLIAGAFLTKKR